MIILSLFFPALILAAVAVYFYRRKQKLKRMELRDKIDDMFSEF